MTNPDFPAAGAAASDPGEMHPSPPADLAAAQVAAAPVRRGWAEWPSWPVAVVALAVLVAVTADVLGHAAITRLDRHVADWAWAANFRHGSLPRAVVVYAVTMPGDILGICAVFVPFVLILARVRRTWQPILRAGAGLGLVLIAVWAGKHLIGRTPPGIRDAVFTAGRSYPSGHSAVAVITTGILAWLAVDYALPAGWTWLFRVGAIVGPLLTATGMVLLVYHWLSDTIAGLAVGLLVLRVVHVVFAGRLGHWGDAPRLDEGRRARPQRRHAPAGSPLE